MNGILVFVLCVCTLLGALYPLLFKGKKIHPPKDGWKTFDDERD